MLPKQTVEEAESLLKEGKLSKRAIARNLGISRITLDKIAKRLLNPNQPPPPPQIKIVHFHEGDDRLALEDRPTYARCKGCGGMQQDHVPCMVCQLRKKAIDDYDCYMNELLSPAPKLSPLSKFRPTAASPEKTDNKPKQRKSSKLPKSSLLKEKHHAR